MRGTQPQQSAQLLSVSIHAPRCRGAMPQAIQFTSSGPDVSIHAPRCRGAMLSCRAPSPCPAPGFQSTPPVAGGRCKNAKAKMTRFRLVSIHAPRCRGAMRGTGCRLRRYYSQFQSTPPVAGGRCAAREAFDIELKVSIHAPRCRGGDAAWVTLLGVAIFCFNPRPPLPGGDAALAREYCCWSSWFQSTPPVAGGRCIQ